MGVVRAIERFGLVITLRPFAMYALDWLLLTEVKHHSPLPAVGRSVVVELAKCIHCLSMQRLAPIPAIFYVRFLKQA